MLSGRRILSFLSLVAVAFAPLLVGADEPLNHTFDPAPPGIVTQNTLMYLAGQAMHSQWRAVASKKNIATNASHQAVYQKFLSIYAIDGTTYKLRYQSPRDGGPLDTVKKASGADMWFPYQDLKIVGSGQFMQPTVDQLVVQAHQAGADCGTATITVFGYDTSKSKVVKRVVVTNGCDLEAKIVHEGTSDAIRLIGPYYGPNAALCCPTKPKASAMLRYRHGKWVQTPVYFTQSS
jgi:hypothetical protein